jgi:HTH-type transcriptional regulator / antitoxin HigA
MPAVLERYRPAGIEAPTLINSDVQLKQHTAAFIESERNWSSLSDREKKYANLLPVLIEIYEAENDPIRSASPLEVLHELIEANGLTPRDLPALLRSESIVSEILNGNGN